MTITEIKEVLSCHDAGLCRVYRATMRSEAEPDQCYEVVCKLAIGRRHFNRLSDEAAIYKKLGSSPPVGTRVPKCYGLFVGEIYDGKIAVLMLADCGEQLEVSMAHQPLTFRSQIIDHLLVLHQDAGVELGGFTEQNIVVKSNGRGEYWPTIVGFGYAHQSHTCDKFDGKIALYTPLPEVEAIGCPELWDALKKLELYIPSTFQFMGQDIPIEPRCGSRVRCTSLLGVWHVG
ncbi:hypothetical protein L227DRAFT_579657 [Lentinus tigrinus ALCF2SS1-6]|uniref:Protein kinase domain-containing protein n=1 Tax=Lentinus tigrinus ALCF2SS1-6 TaxID=1328759 RepID=A0A5C2RW07_9APHY|nr:hypothetical protein L227DRAFT_579657 [Lentinus tigrinus ALCF2SS1-6]